MVWFVGGRWGSRVIPQSSCFAGAVIDDGGVDEECEEGGAELLC
jgi:hypothetical protein